MIPGFFRVVNTANSRFDSFAQGTHGHDVQDLLLTWNLGETSSSIFMKKKWRIESDVFFPKQAFINLHLENKLLLISTLKTATIA